MKNIDLKSLGGKDVSFVIRKADELFKENLEGKIHAHKLYSLLLEQIPNIYEKKKERILRGNLRQKIWDCERTYFWNEKYASQAGQDKIIKDFFFRNKDKILLYELLCTECLLIYLPYLVDQQEDLRKYKFLQQTADWLCYKSSDRGPIKIGLILQGLSPQPHIQNIITLGCHDETAYWAGIALRLAETDSDQGLFQIMSSLQGWGRIQCI